MRRVMRVLDPKTANDIVKSLASFGFHGVKAKAVRDGSMGIFLPSDSLKELDSLVWHFVNGFLSALALERERQGQRIPYSAT